MRRIEPAFSPSAQAVVPDESPQPQTLPASPAGPSNSKAISVRDSGSYEPLYEPQTRFANSSLAELDHLLTRRVTDLVITDEEANRALQVLHETRPQDFKKVLDQLDRSGKLETFLNESTPETRDQFLELLWSKGQLQRRLASPPSGAFNPPVPPEPFVATKDLPEPLQQAIHSNGRDAWSQYETRFKEYQQRYCTAVTQAKTPAELRMLGEPAVPSSAPGRTLTNSRALDALNAKIHLFRSEAPGGSGAILGTFEARVGGLKHGYQVRTDLSGTRSKLEQGLELKGGPVSVGATFGGTSEVALELARKLPGSEVKVGGEVTARSDGSAEFELFIGKAAVRTDVNPSAGTLAAGACFTLHEDDTTQTELKACLDLEGKGIAEDVVKKGWLNPTGYFEVPPELKAGKSWDSLSEPRRDQLAYRNWTKEEWNQQLLKERR